MTLREDCTRAAHLIHLHHGNGAHVPVDGFRDCLRCEETVNAITRELYEWRLGEEKRNK